MTKITRALISVSDKTGVIEFAKFLGSQGVEVISTGGTYKAIKDAGVKVKDISEHTGFPEIMDGRVKTLHPKVHGGLLNVRDNSEHQKQKTENNITDIDLVVVNLYPFEETVKKGAAYDEVIENIDIGGPSMVRSAAKNHKFVTIVVDHNDYAEVQQNILDNKGNTTLELRKKLAYKAYSRTAEYDAHIAKWFAGELNDTLPEKLTIPAKRKAVLRYGENSHQQAGAYVLDEDIKSAVNAKIIQGKELSYNNILDADSALELVKEFEQPASVIIKHNNPCGVAVADNITNAYKNALGCDPVSAFGGIMAFNREVNKETAEEISKIFSEVIIAPSYSKDALEVFAAKKNLRVLRTGDYRKSKNDKLTYRSINGGLLVQEYNNTVLDKNNLKIVTKRKPTDKEMEDMIFAFTVCKHVKSNAIIYVKDQTTVGIGAGQMSRVDSTIIGAQKAARDNKNVNTTKGSVVASDAFFPFADGLLECVKNGVTAVIQPGGSIRDDEVIKAADDNNIAMVFTGIRHFRH